MRNKHLDTIPFHPFLRLFEAPLLTRLKLSGYLLNLQMPKGQDLFPLLSQIFSHSRLTSQFLLTLLLLKMTPGEKRQQS